MFKLLKRLFGKRSAPDPVPEPPLESTEKEEPVRKSSKPWIGVDLDGTLAHSENWRGGGHVGKPVPLMMERVRRWIDSGYTVKILTARASEPDLIPPVQAWLKKQGLPDLEVTCSKDFNMIELWDDRAIQVIPNTGRHVLRPSLLTNPKAPALENEANHETCLVESPSASIRRQMEQKERQQEQG